MFPSASKLLAACGLALVALSLVAATGSHDPRAVRKRSSLDHGLGTHPHQLLPRQRNRGGQFRGGGRGNPFANAISRANKITDGQLNPGGTGGQNQGVNNAQGTGDANLNATSGLPADIVDTGDPQKNLFLDPSQVATGLANDGQAVASATSVNNFINNCLLRTDLPLTNGQQVTGGSCNAVPMGVIAAQNRMPSSKFTNPKNLDVIAPDTTFTIQMAINNLETGNFVNAQQNYFSAPQATNAQGIIAGHSHVVVEQIDSLTSTAVTDPTQFAFFKGLNDAAVNGVLSATVDGGLPEGVYKLFQPYISINSASNHQPALVGVAQHGSLDDAVYFIASNDPNALQTALGLNANDANSAAAANNKANANAGAADANAGNADANAANGNAAAATGANAAQGQAQNQDAGAGTAAAGASQQGNAAVGPNAGASTTPAAAAAAAATTSAAPAAAATTSAAQGQQQQQQGQQQSGGRTGRFGGRQGGRGNNKRRDFPHAGPPSLLERRLAELLAREDAA